MLLYIDAKENLKETLVQIITLLSMWGQRMIFSTDATAPKVIRHIIKYLVHVFADPIVQMTFVIKYLETSRYHIRKMVCFPFAKEDLKYLFIYSNIESHYSSFYLLYSTLYTE